MNKKINKKGFTLIELTLYIAIVSVFIISISTFFSVIMETRIRNQTIDEVNQQGMSVMLRMTQNIRNSTTINGLAAGSNSNLLSINTTNGSTTPTIFDLSGNAIRIKEGTGNAVNLTSNRVIPSNLTFTNSSTNANSNSIKIQFTLTHINVNNRQEFNFSQTFNGSATTRQ